MTLNEFIEKAKTIIEIEPEDGDLELGMFLFDHENPENNRNYKYWNLCAPFVMIEDGSWSIVVDVGNLSTEKDLKPATDESVGFLKKEIERLKEYEWIYKDLQK